MCVVGEASDGDDALHKLRALPVDVIVLDMSMPGKHGVALIQQIKLAHPTLPILVLSMHLESQYALLALRSGAAGYITKNAATTQLIEGIRKVARGGSFVPPNVAEKLVHKLQHPQPELPHQSLTPREFQIFHMLVAGHDINAIARTLSLSNKTISTHKANILKKMDIASTAGLVHYAVRHRLIEEDCVPLA